jgi:hypothetical protein
MKMPMNDEEQLEFDRMKTARDSLLITNARLNSKLAERTWVGLTDEDKESFWTADQMTQEEWDELFKAIEAKLKERNT